MGSWDGWDATPTGSCGVLGWMLPRGLCPRAIGRHPSGMLDQEVCFAYLESAAGQAGGLLSQVLSQAITSSLILRALSGVSASV